MSTGVARQDAHGRYLSPVIKVSEERAEASVVRRQHLPVVRAHLRKSSDGGREHLRVLVVEQLVDDLDDLGLCVSIYLKDFTARMRGHLAHVRRRVTRALFEGHGLDLHNLTHTDRREHAERCRADKLIVVGQITRECVHGEERAFATGVVKISVCDEIRVHELLQLHCFRLHTQDMGGKVDEWGCTGIGAESARRIK